MCSTLSKRPSAYLLDDRPDAWLRYLIDRTVVYAHHWFDGMLNQRDDKGKPLHTLESLLKDRPSNGAGLLDHRGRPMGGQRFSDPRSLIDLPQGRNSRPARPEGGDAS